MTGPHDYDLYGLRLRSELPLPELISAEGEGRPDVLIRAGHVPPPDGRDGEMEAFSGGARFAVAGVARYAIGGGREIVVDLEPGASERNVRLYLLGSAMGMIVHQRGLLPLHANAIEIDGRAFAFMGPSGSGKSTLAAWFHRQGYRMLADDVCVISWNGEGRAMVAPGLPRFRLWRDALERLGGDPGAYLRSYDGDDDYEKYDVPAGGSGTRPLPLGALYVLEPSDQFAIGSLDGVARAEVVIANTYRGGYLRLIRRAVEHWRSSMRVAQDVRIHRVERSWRTDLIEADNHKLLAHVASISAPANSVG